MSVSSDSALTSTVDGGRALLSSTFLDFCSKVRNNDPSILPALGEPFKIRHMCEREGIVLADALLKNTSITYLELETGKYTKSFAEAMAEYVRSSKHLQHIRWSEALGAMIDDREFVLRHREEMFSYFLPAFQESTSLEKLHMELPRGDGSSNLALENMLTHTQSLQSLTLSTGSRQLVGRAIVAAASSGLKNNTTLRELTLDFSQGAITPILTSLCNHPHLRKLSFRRYVVDVTGLETVLLSDTSKITELEIRRIIGGSPIIGLTSVLQALARRPTLTKLALRQVVLGRDQATLLRVALSKMPSLQSLVLTCNTLGSAGLAELAPALYHNTSIKVLDISLNLLHSARLLRDILRRNKTMTALNLSWNNFGGTTGAVECIADGLGSNSTLLKIDLSGCALEDGGVSTLAQTLGSRNTTLQKLNLGNNTITSTGIGVLLEAMEQSSHHITDLDLQNNHIVNEGANLLARSLGNNALPNLTRLSLYNCDIGDDGFIALVSALEQNTSLLYLDLRINHGLGERAFSALAKSLPEIKVLQQVDLSWCPGLASAVPLLLEGLRKNTSLFRFHVAGCAPSSVPPSPEYTARCAGGWMQEMERLGYRNRFLPLIRAPIERLPPRGIWPHALARVAILPDVIFEVLRSKPNLVPSAGTGCKEAAEDTGVPKKRKRGND
jgi:Ran GTPase-activating protein (RanGAP) involved in mRNA processing and transport